MCDREGVACSMVRRLHCIRSHVTRASQQVRASKLATVLIAALAASRPECPSVAQATSKLGSVIVCWAVALRPHEARQQSSSFCCLKITLGVPCAIQPVRRFVRCSLTIWPIALPQFAIYLLCASDCLYEFPHDIFSDVNPLPWTWTFGQKVKATAGTCSLSSPQVQLPLSVFFRRAACSSGHVHRAKMSDSSLEALIFLKCNVAL